MVKIEKIVLIVLISLLSFIENNYLESISISRLLASGRYPRVSEDGVLDLSDLRIHDLTGIEKYPKIKSVRHLIIYDNKLTNLDPLTVLDNQLEILDAANNSIKDVSALRNCQNLKEVYLESNKIDDENLNILKSLDLKRLQIDDNPLKNRIYGHLYIRLQRPNLNYAEIFRNYDDVAIDTIDINNDEDEENKVKDEVNEVKKDKKNEVIKCPICLRSDDDDTFVRTSCFHLFHDDCLAAWTKRGNKDCPLCRKKIIDNE